jgi:L-fuconolactonase
MTYAIELARRCPDTQFILDHIGKPDIKNGLKDPWWSQIRELAH